MDIKLQTTRLDASLPADLQRAADLLRSGRLVAFPTETVYGLGANAFSHDAVEAIFAAKQRPHWDPLIVHVADRAMLAAVAQTTPESLRLIDAFWPGPLTLLLPRTAAIPAEITAGRPLVGVRMPAHPVSLTLIQAAGVPIAAPSANRFGHTSPTTAAHVLADLDGRIDAVLNGGATTVGLESTVVGIGIGNAGDTVTIFRPGAITSQMLEAVVGQGNVETYQAVAQTSVPPEGLPSPGVGLRHYAPRARLHLVDATQAAIDEAVQTCGPGAGPVAVMLPDGWSAGGAPLTYAWGPWEDGKTLARRLFSGLRALDDVGANLIICPVPQMAGIGDALRDRLHKAAQS